MIEQMICSGCGWHGTWSDVLQSPNPFDPDDMLTGCPKCRQVESLGAACFAEGCGREATCGTPTQDGYKWSCAEHRPDAAASQSETGAK